MKEAIEKFKKGTQYLDIVSAVGKKELTDLAGEVIPEKNYSVVKFVPASGAATRMFKDLYQYLKTEEETEFVQTFFDHLEDFAFYEDLNESMAVTSLDKEDKANRLAIVEAVLDSEMKYGDYPKAFIDFHRYNDEITRAIDEQVYESAYYLNPANRKLHFTIADKDEDLFQNYLKEIEESQESIEIDYSFQKKETDTLAVDLENEPFLLENGEYLWRAGGHGALIENLNQIQEDIVFIKNIDNVCHRSRLKDTVDSKKKLAAVGVKAKEEIDSYIKQLLSDRYDLKEIEAFIQDSLNIHLKKELTKEEAFKFLNRPLRVCGVVKNQGEPGGGPFIVDNGDYTDLQICETSEIDQEDPEQKEKLEKADYFNPVDLVCFVKDYKGDKYNLLDFVNEERYFISEKSHEGRALKALEHPGLWNGAMHHWNTLFVEVPLSTFNPVKTVNDLLKEGHQALT